MTVTPHNTLIYGYDARSNLTLAADDDSRVTFSYDEHNRLQTTTDGTAPIAAPMLPAKALKQLITPRSP